jgi:hypothetical protein
MKEEEVITLMVKAGCNLGDIQEVLPDRDGEAIRHKVKSMRLQFIRHGTQINEAALNRILKLRKG